MYKLGVRVAISERPVILIREQSSRNRRVFDITGFYTFSDDPFRCADLEKHLVEKLRRLENGEETYANPVLAIIREETARESARNSALATSKARSRLVFVRRALQRPRLLTSSLTVTLRRA